MAQEHRPEALCSLRPPSHLGREQHRGESHRLVSTEPGRCWRLLARQPWSADVDHDASAAVLARLLLGARADRIEAALDKARSGVARTLVETAPPRWHDNAESLRTARESAGPGLNEAASLLGIKSATLERFEHGTGKLPGRPVALRYLQLVALTCAQTHIPVPDCIPEVISQPAISPTTV